MARTTSKRLARDDERLLAGHWWRCVAPGGGPGYGLALGLGGPTIAPVDGARVETYDPWLGWAPRPDVPAPAHAPWGGFDPEPGARRDLPLYAGLAELAPYLEQIATLDRDGWRVRDGAMPSDDAAEEILSWVSVHGLPGSPLDDILWVRARGWRWWREGVLGVVDDQRGGDFELAIRTVNGPVIETDLRTSSWLKLLRPTVADGTVTWAAPAPFSEEHMSTYCEPLWRLLLTAWWVSRLLESITGPDGLHPADRTLARLLGHSALTVTKDARGKPRRQWVASSL